MGGVATLSATDRSRPAVEPVEPPSPHSSARRRFTIAVVLGMAAVTIPYLFVLWDLWNPGPSFLRPVPPDFFYDSQARAMFHGHLYLPTGWLGIEAFNHDGHQFTYFGIFPSLLRMPVLLVTSRFDGRLTAPSMLISWVVTGVFSSMMVWRLRILVRGQAVLGRAEAACYGLFVATIAGGSVLIYLSATPFVYNEDFAWSVALTTGTLFTLLGVLERPTWRRVVACGVLVLFANLDRTPAGYACVIGAGLVAVWFGMGRGGSSNRRWMIPMLGVAFFAFAVSCAVTYAKFGLPVGLPMADQVWAQVNAHRRYFLAANGGKAFSLAFLPSTIVAYLQPFGIHFTGVFPYITEPTAPAAAYAGAVLDDTYPTASVPPTMPLLFLLSIWGVVAAYRPRPAGRLALARIPLFAAAAGISGVLLWGYIANRYMGDFMPFLILAGAVGLIDVWRRLQGRSLRSRRLALAGVAVLAAFSLVANIAIAIEPSAQWNPAELTNYTTVQKALSVQNLASTVHHGATLPYWAPAGELYIVGNCSGLYYSTGETYATVPGQQLMHWTWSPVEQGPGIIHTIDVTFNEPQSAVDPPFPILRFGNATLDVEQGPFEDVQLQVVNAGAKSVSFPSAVGGNFPISPGVTYQFQVITDPNMNAIEVSQGGSKIIGHYLPGKGPATVLETPPSSPIVVTDVTTPAKGEISLCRSLLRGA